MNRIPTNYKRIGQAFKLGFVFARGLWHRANDESRWITYFPNGEKNKGRHALIDTDTGEILKGYGGKWDGRHVSATAKHGTVEQHGAQAKIDRAHAIAGGWKPQTEVEKFKKLKSGATVRTHSESGRQYPAKLVGKDPFARKERFTAESFAKKLREHGMDLPNEEYIRDYLDKDDFNLIYHPDVARKQIADQLKADGQLEGEHALTTQEFEWLVDVVQHRQTTVAARVLMRSEGFPFRRAQRDTLLPEIIKLNDNSYKVTAVNADDRAYWERNEIGKEKHAAGIAEVREYLRNNAFKNTKTLTPRKDFSERLSNCGTADDVISTARDSGIFASNKAKIDFRNISLSTGRAVVKTYYDLCEKYPVLTGAFSEIYQKPDKKAMATMYMNTGSANLVPAYFQGQNAYVNEAVAKCEKTGFHPPTDTDGITAVVSHEIGHRLEGVISQALWKATAETEKQVVPRRWGVVSKRMMESLMKQEGFTGAKGFSRRVSGYAATNSVEWFAESFCELTCSKNPRPQTVAFGKMLDKILSGDFEDIL